MCLPCTQCASCHPAPRCGVQKRISEAFIYGVLASIYLMRYSPPLRTVSFADIPWIPHHVRNDPIQRELQSPEALFVARPGYDPGTFPILYRDALTLRYQLLDIYSTLLILYLSLPSHGGPFLRIGFAIHQFPRPAASGTRRSSRIVLRQASGYIVSITYIVSIACT